MSDFRGNTGANIVNGKGITVQEIGVFSDGKLISKSAFAPVTLSPGDDLEVNYKLKIEAPKPKARTEEEYQVVYKELLQLRKAVRDVYLAGHWTINRNFPNTLKIRADEDLLWKTLRDAAAIPVGSSKTISVLSTQTEKFRQQLEKVKEEYRTYVRGQRAAGKDVSLDKVRVFQDDIEFHKSIIEASLRREARGKVTPESKR